MSGSFATSGMGTSGMGTSGMGTSGMGIWLPPQTAAVPPLDDNLRPFAKGQGLLVLGGRFPDAALSPAVRAAMALAAFAGTNWQSETVDPPDDGEAALKSELKALLEHVPMRAGRSVEILAQHAEIETPFLRILLAEGPGRPGLQALLATGLTIGSMVVMHWKAKFRRARPVQVYPGLVPLFATPQHPSYPSGHALQGYLIAKLLARAANDAGLSAAYNGVLEAMADRIAVNREIGGVHFPSDSRASEELAPKLLPLIVALDPVKAMLSQAAAELGGARVGAKPEPPVLPKP